MSQVPRVAVITGASAGIGAATARALARRGDAVVLAARGAEALRAVAGEIARGVPQSAGERVHTVAADVTRRTDVERIREEAVRTFGRVDVWINNAGRGITRPVLELTDEDIDEMVAVNVRSVLYGIQTIVPYFQERNSGHLINISSFLSRVPLATMRSAYSAAKAAVNTLTANLRVDLRVTHPGIHVTLVMPGIVATDFAKHARWSTGPAAAPGGLMRPQTAEEVAEVIAEVIDHPVAEVYTSPASHAMAQRYYEDVGAFEAASVRP